MSKPLLLIGFPRGFTSRAYQIVQKATGLREVLGVGGDGEILNMQRILRDIFQRTDLEQGASLPFYDESDDVYDWVERVLLGAYRMGGANFIVKDVSQPFHVLRFLEKHPDLFNVLYVKRDLAEVEFSLRWRRWTYVHSMEALAALFERFPSIDVTTALSDHRHVFERLRAHFDYPLTEFNYIDESFIVERERFYAAFRSDRAQRPATIDPVGGVSVFTPNRDYGVGYGREGSSLLARGWSGPEEGYIWSDGFEAALEFFTPPNGRRASSLSLEISSYWPQGADPIRLAASIGGREVAHLVFGDERERFSIPLDTAESPCSILLRVENPRRPCDHEETTDSRMLGVAVHAFRFSAAEW
jgi:hypothetical protein